MKIIEGVFQVGGGGLSDSRDAASYLVADRGAAALIDAGCGQGTERILDQIRQSGIAPDSIQKLLLTHSHIDHTGGAAWLAARLNLSIVAHARCAQILAVGNDPLTAASWYNLSLPPLTVDAPFDGPELRVPVGGQTLVCLYTPGHSPCSISIYADLPGLSPDREGVTADPPIPAGRVRVLFGQDIHGPIHPALGSDRRLYRQSLERLAALGADYLCEGHFGVFRGAFEVADYIQSYL